MWQNVTTSYGRNSTYTMYVDDEMHPVRYEMHGYNTLFGSHYDKYYLDYDKLMNFSGDPFNLPTSK